MSGVAAVADGVAFGADRFLMKPFGIGELAATVEEPLAERRT